MDNIPNIDYLIYGEKKVEKSDKGEDTTPEEQKHINKLLEILRGDDEQGKKVIISNLDIMTKKTKN